MAFDGSGNFIRLYNWVQDAANGINITASRVDGEDGGFAAGLSLAVTRDGQGKMAADLTPVTDNTYNLGVASKRWATINQIPIAPLSNLAGDIRNYGAITGVDCATAVTSAAAANTLVIIPAGTWPMAATPTIPTGVVIEARPGSNFSGAGASALGLSSSYITKFSEYNALAADIATVNYFRNANYTGGTPAFVSSAVRIQTNVSAAVTNYEWALTSIVNNSATAGQNVAGYFQGNKIVSNAGPTWGATIALREMTATANPTTGSVALELDMEANGTDTNSGRVLCDAVILPHTPYASGGATVTATFGYRVSNGNDGVSTVSFPFALGQGLQSFCGFDTSKATCTTAAYMMAQGQGIIFDGPTTLANSLVYDGVGLSYKVSGVVKTRLLATGGIAVDTAGVAQPVLGPRIGGYGTPTGSVKVASFPGATASLLQCSQMIAQIVTDLKTHGLLGS